MIPKLLTLRQAAEYLNVSVFTLYRYTSQGKIPFVRIGSMKMFTQDILDEFIAQNTAI